MLSDLFSILLNQYGGHLLVGILLLALLIRQKMRSAGSRDTNRQRYSKRLTGCLSLLSDEGSRRELVAAHKKRFREQLASSDGELSHDELLRHLVTHIEPNKDDGGWTEGRRFAEVIAFVGESVFPGRSRTWTVEDDSLFLQIYNCDDGELDTLEYTIDLPVLIGKGLDGGSFRELRELTDG